MGRPLLIIITGLTVIFGIIQLGVWQRFSMLSEENAKSAETYDLRHHARSGLDEGIRRISHESSAEFPFELITDGVTTSVSLSEGSGNELEPHQTRINAVSNGYGDKVYEAHAIVQRPEPVPQSRGAIGMYSENNHMNIRGNVKISGNDKSGSGSNLPGITGASDKDDALSMSGQSYTIEGEPENYMKDDDINPDELNEFYERYMETGQRYTDESSSFGTPDDPSVMIMEGENKFSGGTGTMGGVMVVPPGSKLELGGSFEFEGLIVNLGELQIRGNVEIRGGVMFGEDSEGDFDDAESDEMTGTSRIYYDSDVIGNLKKRVDVSRPNEPKQVVALYE